MYEAEEMGHESEEASEAKVSALKDLVKMMQGMIAEAGGEPDEEVVPDEMPLAASAEESESALGQVMSSAESDTGMGNELKSYMNGSKIKPKGKSLNIAKSFSSSTPKAPKAKSKSKKSKMKRYG